MKTRTLKQLLLYNYRYFFAYVVIIVFTAYFLGWRLTNVGPGIAQQEIVTAARHVSLSSILHQPLYILHPFLQWGSMHLFGITAWSLRLPSIIIAALTAITLYNLLKRWFGKSTALLSTALLISADWFLFVARLGVGAIEFSLWLALSLLCFTKLLERKNNWVLLLAVSLVGLLFAPLGIYAAITLVASLFGCRVFRERFFEAVTWIRVTSASIVFLAIIAIVYASYQNLNFLKNILAIQTLPTVTGFLGNMVSNMSSVVAIFPNSNPAISPTGIFVVRYFELIFILFGVVMLWKTRVNRLNLTVLIVSVVLVITSGFSSGSRGSGVMLVPAAIYMTAGIRHLMHRWRRTFPNNPYARVTAYLPLAILFLCVVSAHYLSYFVLWPAQSDTHVAFTRDFMLVKNELNQPAHQSQDCFVQTDNRDLQKLIVASKTVCKPLFPTGNNLASTAKTQIIQPGVAGTVFVAPNQLSQGLVSDATNNSVRWVVLRTVGY